MDMIKEAIVEWLREILVGGIVSNLSGLFDSTNERVAEIAGQVGTTPMAWNSSIYNMVGIRDYAHCRCHSGVCHDAGADPTDYREE